MSNNKELSELLNNNFNKQLLLILKLKNQKRKLFRLNKKVSTLYLYDLLIIQKFKNKNKINKISEKEIKKDTLIY